MDNNTKEYVYLGGGRNEGRITCVGANLAPGVFLQTRKESVAGPV